MPVTPEWSLVVDSHNVIGEGPAWDAQTGTLLWIDIIGRLVQRYDPSIRRTTTRLFDQQIGAVVPRATGGLALALEDGIWVTEDDTGPARRIAPIETDDPLTRLNDAKCDRRGRLWAGSMAHDSRPLAGALYRVDPDGSVEQVVDDTTISNGIDWSPDDRRMYYIDSAAHRLDVFDYDLETGRVTGRRTLVEFPADAGLPDGMAADVKGCLWVAFYDGWAVRRYTPAGKLDRVIELPVARVTSCAFAGSDLGDLYITTASAGLSEAQQSDQPLAGALFVARPGVTGFAATPFAG